MQEGLVLLRLGELLANRGRGHEGPARAHVEKALEQEAPLGQAHATLGVIAEVADDEEEAETWYRKSLEQAPESSEVLTRLANLVLYKKPAESDAPQNSGPPPQVLEARRLYQQALERDGTNVEALAGMGRTYFWEDTELDPGLQLLASAASLRPDRVDIVVDLVNLLARSGRRQAAWMVLDQKLRGGGTDPEVLADAEGRIAVAEMEAAFERIRADDESGAMAILEAAMQRVQDPTVQQRLALFRDQLVAGDSASSPAVGPAASTAFVVEDLEEAERLLDRHNEAVKLLNAGHAEQALTILDGELEDCAQPQICESIRELHAQISAWIGKSRGIDRYNEAVDLLERGKRKAAIEILRELDDESMDEEVRRRARELMDQIGVRQPDDD
jgi:tetratricopeptide (TPR) repeat protein